MANDLDKIILSIAKNKLKKIDPSLWDTDAKQAFLSEITRKKLTANVGQQELESFFTEAKRSEKEESPSRYRRYQKSRKGLVDPATVAPPIDWQEICIDGTSDTLTYTLQFQVPLPNEKSPRTFKITCSDIELENPRFFARRIRHILQRFDIECPYEAEGQAEAWRQSVLQSWMKRLSTEQRREQREVVADVIRSYCERETKIAAQETGCFSQASNPVLEDGVYFIPYAGALMHVKRKLGQSIAERAVTNALLALHGQGIRKGKDRIYFYAVDEKYIYAQDSNDRQAGSGEDKQPLEASPLPSDVAHHHIFEEERKRHTDEDQGDSIPF